MGVQRSLICHENGLLANVRRKIVKRKKFVQRKLRSLTSSR